MKATVFFNLEDGEKVKKHILFIILLLFAATAVLLNITQQEVSQHQEVRYMSLANKETSEKFTVVKEKTTVKWKGQKLTGSHTGTVPVKSGTLEISDGVLIGGTFVFDMQGMANEDIENEKSKTKLMGHLRSGDFFNTAEYPEAKLVITDVKTINGEGREYEVTGDLTIKGKTNSITFPARINQSEGELEATADITFDRTKWDIRYGSGSIFDNLGDKAIYDDVEISVNLMATRKPE